MILLLAAALAAAAPQPLRAPIVVTPDALVCRALEARGAAIRRAPRRRSSRPRWLRPTSDPKTARLWAAAGNMWIAANEEGKAAVDLDKALALPGLEAEQRGEALLDRARVAEAQGDLKTARAQTRRSRADHRRRSFLLVFFGRAGDPRE